MQGYKDLIVWRKAVDLSVNVYSLTAQLPTSEKYGICSQMQRAAVSIPSNIAEGSRRKSKKDFAHFLTIAFGSGAELETQIEILKKLPFAARLEYSKIDSLLDEVMRMLNSMITYEASLLTTYY